jgi:hypothetical protein
MTEEQAAILAPTMLDLSVQSILKDAGGAGAKKKLAQRKLNNAGAITNHCGLQNHPGRVKKLLAAAQLAASLAEISALTKATKEQGKCKADTELMDLAPASLVKLNSEKVNGDLTELSKKEIRAISFHFFGCMYKEANPKPVLVLGRRGSGGRGGRGRRGLGRRRWRVARKTWGTSRRIAHSPAKAKRGELRERSLPV